jgi:hypothetical protein
MEPRSRGVAAALLLLSCLGAATCLGTADAQGAQLTASWIDNSNGGATTRLERRLQAATTYVAIADVPSGVSDYVDRTVSPGTTYCYRALAFDANGVSPYSDEACATSNPDGQVLAVTVSKAGDGAGTVTSAPAGISCGSVCADTYPAGASVTLTATAAAGSVFAGWSGACAGVAPCILAGNAPVTAIATFAVVSTAFVDVTPAHPFAPWIDAVTRAGIAAGCSSAPPQFCPDHPITRSEMAVLLLRAIHGAAYQPPAADGVFADVPLTDPFARWIERLAEEGLTGGCATNPLQYCPAGAVTRGQMAVFLLRATHGAAYTPGAVSGRFADVPSGHPFATWIEQLAREGITTGCGLDAYCPDAPVTRGQMAVFLVRAFDLPI